jgi:hypothetical protein
MASIVTRADGAAIPVVAARIAPTLEDHIRQRLPALREWMINVIAETAVKKYLARRASADDNVAEQVGPARLQTPGPGQT